MTETAPHPHGSLVEQVHRVITVDQGVTPWVLAEEIVKTMRQILGREIGDEAKARETPPHLDGLRREGVHAGLRLAERIVTETPDVHPDADFPDDPGSMNVHHYPTARLRCKQGSRPHLTTDHEPRAGLSHNPWSEPCSKHLTGEPWCPHARCPTCQP